MQQEYTTIYSPAEDEFVERKSRFIGHIAPVQTEEEAQAWMDGHAVQTVEITLLHAAQPLGE